MDAMEERLGRSPRSRGTEVRTNIGRGVLKHKGRGSVIKEGLEIAEWRVEKEDGEGKRPVNTR